MTKLKYIYIYLCCTKAGTLHVIKSFPFWKADINYKDRASSLGEWVSPQCAGCSHKHSTAHVHPIQCFSSHLTRVVHILLFSRLSCRSRRTILMKVRSHKAFVNHSAVYLESIPLAWSAAYPPWLLCWAAFSASDVTGRVRNLPTALSNTYSQF